MAQAMRKRQGGVERIAGLDLEDVLQQSALVAADVCQSHWAAIFLLSEESQLVHCVALHPEMRTVPPRPLESGLFWAQVVKRNAPLVANDPGAFSEADRKLVDALGIQAALGLPIVIGGRCLGALIVADVVGRAFGATEIERGIRVARNIAAAVEKANLYQEATQRIAELSLLHEVGRAFNESLELPEILDTCADQLAELLGASSCFIFLCEGDTLRCVAASGPRREEVAELVLRIDEPSIAATSIRERRAVASVDVESDPRAASGLVKRQQTKSVLAIPMFHRGREVGAVTFDERRARRLFSPAEIERASLVASHLAAALDNARLYDHLRASYAELAQAQARLVRRERLAAIGELAAQVAHEVRNPLGAVFNAAGELRRILGPSGQTGYLLDVLGEEAERINRIISDLIDFARPLELSLQTGVLASTLEDAQRAVFDGTKVVVERHLEGDVSGVALDPRLMRQAFLNLFQNASQAMQGIGTVHIKVRVVSIFGGTWAEVAVEDTGPGVDVNMRNRIFEPFFTTKATGIGLGLAVIKRIAEAHQGEVSVAEGTSGGAIFVLRWPERMRGEA